MPVALQGKLDGGSLAATGEVVKETCLGVVGNNYIQLKDDKTPATAISAGAQNKYEITVGSVTGIEIGQIVEATNVPAQTRVVGVNGNVVTLDKPVNGGNATCNDTFRVNVGKANDATVGLHSFFSASANLRYAVDAGIGTVGSIGIATESISFTCAKDDNATTHSYPRLTDPIHGAVIGIGSVTV